MDAVAKIEAARHISNELVGVRALPADSIKRYLAGFGINGESASSSRRGLIRDLLSDASTSTVCRIAADLGIQLDAGMGLVERFGPWDEPPADFNGSSSMQPTAFISYSWDDDEHKGWVRDLATRLRADGVDVALDSWAAVPGDQLPEFMERAIRDNQFCVIVCTPRYKAKSDAREGGVGYEGDIMTAEVMTQRNTRKFVPVLRTGTWGEAAPSWLAGKYYVNLSGNPYSERDYEDLARTLLGIREVAPPVGKPLSTVSAAPGSRSEPLKPVSKFQDISITRVIVEDVTQPRNDGTEGSALYAVPFALSRKPPAEWSQIFVAAWDHPPRWTSMHRPGIAGVSGSTVTLHGTTIDEVEKYHRDTLQLAASEANRLYREWKAKQDGARTREEAAREQHRAHVEDASKRITFD